MGQGRLLHSKDGMLKAHLCISIAPMEEQDISNVHIYQKQ